MKFRELVQGRTAEAQRALDEFFSGIDQEKILWYPSAGEDYRDVMEMSPERLALHEIAEQPNIICHTDYNHRWTGLDQPALTPILFHKDDHTTIELIEKWPLCFVAEAGIQLCPELDEREYGYGFWREADRLRAMPSCNVPIYFLKLRITSDTLGEINACVFYFIFGNHNFLAQVILKHKLAISHFVKVRQGFGFGGCYNCISVFYSLLGNIGVKYLLVDKEVHYPKQSHDRLARSFRIKHKNYALVRIGTYLRWSDYQVRVYKVEHLPGHLTNKGYNAILKRISDGWGDNSPYKPRSMLLSNSHACIHGRGSFLIGNKVTRKK